MTSNKVSVIVPIFNNAKYFGKCVDSILEQDYELIEIILVDDGSTDGSEKICDTYQSYDSRIKVIHIKNQGVSKARNVGVENATGKYLIFVDSDDYLLKEHVKYMVDLISVKDSVFGVSKKCFFVKDGLSVDASFVNSKNRVLNTDESISLLLSNEIPVGCWNKIYDRQFLLKNKIMFDEQLTYGEGLDFIIRVAKLAKKTVAGEEGFYCYRRDNKNSATSSYSHKKIDDGEKSLLKIKKFVINEDLPLSSKQWDIHYCNYCINAARDTIANGDSDSKKWLNEARTYSKRLLFKKGVPTKYRVKMFIICVCPRLLRLRAKVV